MLKISQGKRLTQRLKRHYGPMLLFTLLFLFIFINQIRSDDNIFRWSMATAYAGLIFLAATLFTGPLNVLRHRLNPISTDLRRDMGIWAAVLCLAHVVIGLNVHLRGRMWLYFLEEKGPEKELVLRFGQFGFANHTGFVAALFILLLLVLSNDLALRKLAPKKWKNWQRTNYLVFLLVAGHGVLYQIIEKRQSTFIILFGVLVAFTLMIQLAGFIKHWQRRLDHPQKP